MTVVAIIPARYDSTRFPGKPLALIGRKPMIQHVYESASKTPGLDRVLVATDDRRILDTVRGFGGEAMLTSRAHRSGTDRLAEVTKRLKAEWVVNVQGDLPFVRPQTIARALRPLWRDRSIPMGTARTPIFDHEEWCNPNVVKVVTDAKGFALYFSRAPIPYPRSHALSRNGTSARACVPADGVWGYRHVGVYVYRRDFLLKFARLRPTRLERTEGLEQLRALAHGYSIRVADVDEPSVEVDTPEDLSKAETYLRRLRG
ncbi:MAG: 3-deoxy-manno-octulosonate cytidylyltransferase [Deltaproteobacteria bacterium]|nr:3-deoxy-manno-octulosonate cytidylyltransferase [Deltaproteobacteria bacterium]